MKKSPLGTFMSYMKLGAGEGAPRHRRRLPCYKLALPLLAAAIGAGKQAEGAPTMGVYLNHGNEAEIVSYEAWIGRSVAPIVDFSADNNWEALTGVSEGYGLSWNLNQWAAAYRNRIVWSIPMLPASGNVTSWGQVIETRPAPTMAEGAAGAYDHHWRNVAATLINKGYGNATLRIGWELNGSWFRWHVNNATEAANYRNYWKKIVRAMRTNADGTPRTGANFRFNWCGTAGDQPSGINPSLAYPDADANGNYVDEIGLDLYDQCWAANTYPINSGDPQWLIDSKRRNAWDYYASWCTYDLAWWVAFAAQKQKPLTIPEWGLAHRPSDNRGGNDNPIFMQRFYDWVSNPANNITWHAYFQENNSEIRSRTFNDSQFPVATAKFLQLFATSTLLQDDFSDGNATGWTGNPAARWSVFSDAGNYVYRFDFDWNNTGGSSIAGESAWSNYTVAARIKITEINTWSDTKLIARYVDSNNHYAFLLADEGGASARKAMLKKRVNGTWTTLASKLITLNLNTNYDIALQVQGGVLTGRLNGTQVVQATDTTISAGRIGLGGYKQDVLFDNVVVTSP